MRGGCTHYAPLVIAGELKTKIDRVWDAFWSGGISNPLEVMEQITYLLFIRRLDDLHTAAENKANRLGQPIENEVYRKSEDQLRWFLELWRAAETAQIGKGITARRGPR